MFITMIQDPGYELWFGETYYIDYPDEEEEPEFKYETPRVRGTHGVLVVGLPVAGNLRWRDRSAVRGNARAVGSRQRRHVLGRS